MALRSVTVLGVKELFLNPFRYGASVPHCFFDFPLMHPLEESQRTFVKSSSDRQFVSMFHTAKEQYVCEASVLDSPKYNNAVVNVVPYTFPSIPIAFCRT